MGRKQKRQMKEEYAKDTKSYDEYEKYAISIILRHFYV